MNKISRVSGAVLLLLDAAFYTFPILLVFSWACIETACAKKVMDCLLYAGPVCTPDALIGLTKVRWTPFTQFLGFCSSVLAWAPAYGGLHYLRRIFAHYKEGAIFSSENALCYSRLGQLFLLNAFIALPLSDGLMVAAVTFSNPVGQRYVCIGASTANLFQCLCAGIFMVVSWVMLEASKLAEEQQLTI